VEPLQLRELAVQALRSMYKLLREGRIDPAQFRQNLNIANIGNQVALMAVEAELWRAPRPIDATTRPYVWTMLPEDDQEEVRAALWELVTRGILIPRSIHDEDNTFFTITRQGRDVLEATQPTPYDPHNFLRRVGEGAPSLEPETLAYLSEAVTCFLHGHNRAAAVMTGLASENEVLALIELYSWSLEAEQRQSFERRIGQARNLKQKFDVLYTHLYQQRGALPEGLREVDVWLNGVFQLVRLTRNDAGHPVGAEPAREAIYANLNLFLLYARNLSGTKEHLRTTTADPYREGEGKDGS
jgi:hypothetical protein